MGKGFQKILSEKRAAAAEARAAKEINFNNNKVIAEFMGENITHSDPDTNMNTVAEKGDKFRFDNSYLGHMGIYSADLKFDKSWYWIMPVGNKMDDLIMNGNWGIHEQFFSDEMHGYDNFRKACADRNLEEANKWAMFFIEALEHQDPQIVKKVKETKI